eukprot:5891772-Pyramimonas_sp.AAC.2
MQSPSYAINVNMPGASAQAKEGAKASASDLVNCLRWVLEGGVVRLLARVETRLTNCRFHQIRMYASILPTSVRYYFGVGKICRDHGCSIQKDEGVLKVSRR